MYLGTSIATRKAGAWSKDQVDQQLAYVHVAHAAMWAFVTLHARAVVSEEEETDGKGCFTSIHHQSCAKWKAATATMGGGGDYHRPRGIVWRCRCVRPGLHRPPWRSLRTSPAFPVQVVAPPPVDVDYTNGGGGRVPRARPASSGPTSTGRLGSPLARRRPCPRRVWHRRRG